MTFKNMLYCTLLVPLFTFGNTEQRVQELNNELSSKMLIISDIGKKIAEKEELIESMTYKVSNDWQEILLSLNEEEKQEFNEEINAFLKRTNQVLSREINVKNFLIQELFENQKKNFALGRIKSAQIRILIERNIWKNLFVSYEQILSELIEIDHQLDILKKQSN